MKDDQDGICMVLAPLDCRILAGPILPRCTKNIKSHSSRERKYKDAAKNDSIEVLEMMCIRPVES